MTLPGVEKEISFEFDREPYKDQVRLLIHSATGRFQKILRSYTLFNLFFYLLMTGEIIYFFVHLTFLVQTFVMAIHLALIFATIFCYFTLHMYAHTWKEEKLIHLRSDFVQACGQMIENPTHRLMIAHACCKLASELHAKENKIYRCPSWCIFLISSFEKINCWWFWEDVHTMKELLLRACVDEHINLVRMEPTDLGAHAGLANAYVMLSGLFVDPRTVEGLDDDRWIPRKKYDASFKKKFRLIAEKAIEEFKILSDYAPHDPWVHAQLAYSYRDLQMKNEEIREYEILLQLCPEDKEALFKLGKLYFEQGKNAKGLQVYETLKRSNYKKAEGLISFYGA
ncbi:MAG: tetratricopeptide repeat protein [Parachlamydiaceae bacterium]